MNTPLLKKNISIKQLSPETEVIKIRNLQTPVLIENVNILDQNNESYGLAGEKITK